MLSLRSVILALPVLDGATALCLGLSGSMRMAFELLLTLTVSTIVFLDGACSAVSSGEGCQGLKSPVGHDGD